MPRKGDARNGRRRAKGSAAAAMKRPKPRKSKKRAKPQGTDFLDPRLSKVLAHPLRVNILAIVSWRIISPSEYARETGEKLSKVSYHFKRLVELGALELVETLPVRGAVKHMYRGTRRAIFAGAGWEELPKSIQDGVAGAALQDFTKVAVRSIENGAFSERDDSHLTWEPVLYDELAFKAMVKILETTRQRLLALQKEAEPRLSKTGQEGLLVAVALAGFEMSGA
jgi:hypothetical protein